MKKYMIEREIPNIGTLEREQLQESAAKSNQVLRQLGPDIQWLESFVTANKMYCMYLASGRVAHLPARRTERLSCHQGHRDRQEDRPHDRRAIARTNSTQGLSSSAWSPQLQPEILTTL